MTSTFTPRRHGQRALVLESFCHCTTIRGLDAPECLFEERLAAMAANAALAKSAGWDESNFYVYLLDETDVHPWMRNVTSRVHALLPRAKTVALGDNAFPYEGAVALATGESVVQSRPPSVRAQSQLSPYKLCL
jgi:hypothetical protein